MLIFYSMVNSTVVDKTKTQSKLILKRLKKENNNKNLEKTISEHQLRI